MLEKVDLNQKLSKEEYKNVIAGLQVKLGDLQRKCKELNIPVMIIFEGFSASGKGVQIGRLIQSLDPRGFQVYNIQKATEEEKMHPFMWRFWVKTPERGRIAIYDGSWYRKVLTDRFEQETREEDMNRIYDSICSFEKLLTKDGNVIVKLLLDIDKAEQKKRMDKLEKNKETAWRVTKDDRRRNKEYDRYEELMDEMLQKTDTEYAPWTIVEATDKRYATVKIYMKVVQLLEEQIEKIEHKVVVPKYSASEEIIKLGEQYQISVLEKTDLSLAYTKEEYKKKLDKLQKRLELLHSELYRNRIPLVIGFEGWDAGGKGGAIKRLTEKMDPRGYVVNPTASPNDIERAHHYLWRFWKNMPKDGHVAIFDRTWYGRVMVERIEGFCTTDEWKRAYREINDMEKNLSDHGAIVLKFWMHIDKDEQERRFKERQENPEKQWKITEEDWRNREKWDQYEQVVNEMLLRTSTENAPWIIVEGNDKYYARIKVLETVVKAIEERLEKIKKNEK